MFLFKKKNPKIVHYKTLLNIETNGLEQSLAFDLKEGKVFLNKVFDEIAKEVFHEHSFEMIEVSLNFVNSEKIQELNKEFRDKDQVTDVLSFPSGMLDEEFDHIELDIGDVFINVDIIEEQAKSIESYPNIETFFLFMHGCLHLIGYDHMNDIEAEEMYKRQREIFAVTDIRKING